MNRNLWLLAVAQGLFLTNNIVFIAINGLVGLSLAPRAWMATLPVMAYVVGGALSTPLVALNFACVAIALTCVELHQFPIALTGLALLWLVWVQRRASVA